MLHPKVLLKLTRQRVQSNSVPLVAGPQLREPDHGAAAAVAGVAADDAALHLLGEHELPAGAGPGRGQGQAPVGGHGHGRGPGEAAARPPGQHRVLLLLRLGGGRGHLRVAGERAAGRGRGRGAAPDQLLHPGLQHFGIL